MAIRSRRSLFDLQETRWERRTANTQGLHSPSELQGARPGHETVEEKEEVDGGKSHSPTTIPALSSAPASGAPTDKKCLQAAAAPNAKRPNPLLPTEDDSECSLLADYYRAKGGEWDPKAQKRRNFATPTDGSGPGQRAPATCMHSR